MIGKMLAKIRKDQGITKTELSKLTDINIGHITHIEKGERNPSHKALKNICTSLNIPYQPLYQTYDKTITQNHIDYKFANHITYNQIPVFENMTNLINCPSNAANASFAFKVTDSHMEPSFLENSYAYVELNTPLNNRDFGLFKYNDEILFKRFVIRKDGLVLRSEDKSIPDIVLSPRDNFIIIGKVIQTNTNK